MGESEPPSTPSSSLSRLFRIGKDSHGRWVVQDQQGLRGGLFANRAEALKFAMFENGNCPQAVVMVPGILELDMTPKHKRSNQIATGTTPALARVAQRSPGTWGRATSLIRPATPERRNRS
jgi:hypothetical protein